MSSSEAPWVVSRKEICSRGNRAHEVPFQMLEDASGNVQVLCLFDRTKKAIWKFWERWITEGTKYKTAKAELVAHFNDVVDQWKHGIESRYTERLPPTYENFVRIHIRHSEPTIYQVKKKKAEDVRVAAEEAKARDAGPKPKPKPMRDTEPKQREFEQDESEPEHENERDHGLEHDYEQHIPHTMSDTLGTSPAGPTHPNLYSPTTSEKGMRADAPYVPASPSYHDDDYRPASEELETYSTSKSSIAGEEQGSTGEHTPRQSNFGRTIGASDDEEPLHGNGIPPARLRESTGETEESVQSAGPSMNSAKVSRMFMLADEFEELVGLERFNRFRREYGYPLKVRDGETCRHFTSTFKHLIELEKVRR